MWRAQIEGLGGSARVVALDLPGFGHSPAPQVEVRTMADFADAVIALADALGFSRFVLCGLSMGGYVAFAVARAHPERLAGLVLCDTRAEPDTAEAVPGRLADAERALREGVGFYVEKMMPKYVAAGAPAGVRAEVERAMRRTPAWGFAAALRGIATRPDARPELGAIAVPTLCVVGAEDALTPEAGMRALAAAVPGAELVVVPGGHLAPLESPEPVNAAVGRFLATRITP
jgi:pimeloyl-ACP methyl ester carboxylesterase